MRHSRDHAVPDTPEGIQAELETVASKLDDDLERLVQGQLTALTSFSQYDHVPLADLRRSCERNVARVVAVLRGDPRLPEWVIEDERESGMRRVGQGIPTEVVVSAYRGVIAVIRDAFLEQAGRDNISSAAMLQGTRRLWDQADHSSSELVATRHQHDLDLAREQEQHRMAFLRGACDGTLHGSRLIADGSEFRIVEQGQYWIARTTPATGDLSLTPRELGRLGGTLVFDPLVGRIDDDLVGILGRPPRVQPQFPAVASVGPVGPHEFQQAFTEATELLNTAARLGLTGLIDHDRLGLRLAVAAESTIGARLHARYVEPVRRGSNMSRDILASISALLAAGLSIRAASSALSIHVNTLRYRVERFEELASCRLQSGDILVEVWWALEYDRLISQETSSTRVDGEDRP